MLCKLSLSALLSTANGSNKDNNQLKYWVDCCLWRELKSWDTCGEKEVASDLIVITKSSPHLANSGNWQRYQTPYLQKLWKFDLDTMLSFYLLKIT